MNHTYDFESTVAYHWHQRMGFHPSDHLIRGWAYIDSYLSTKNQSTILPAIPLPTGSGKTFATSVWCGTNPKAEAAGVLFLTPFRLEAENIASSINALANRTIALSLHSNKTSSDHKINQAPILVTTHEAYSQALKEKADTTNISRKMNRLIQFQHGDRSHLVIDERFDWLDSYEVDIAELRSVPAHLDKALCPNGQAQLRRLSEFTSSLHEDDRPHDRPL